MQRKAINQQILKNLPVAFGRPAINRLLPGIIDAKTLANHDSAGTGPPHFKRGRRVFYERDSFLEWLLADAKKISPTSKG